MPTPSLLTPVAATPANLASVELGVAYAAVVTAATDSCVKIGQATICNITGTSRTVTIGILPNGDVAGDSHAVLYQYPLAAGDTFSLDDILGGHYLAEGDSVIALASAASAVVFSATGVVYT